MLDVGPLLRGCEVRKEMSTADCTSNDTRTIVMHPVAGPVGARKDDQVLVAERFVMTDGERCIGDGS